MTYKTYNVFDIANWFLQKESMGQRKLQKLCYYAQAWNIALNDKPLFDDDFEAWVHGPINRTIWNKFKSFGYLDIPSNKLIGESHSLSDDVVALLERIWSTYGDYSGYQLELLSYSENPWKNARVGLSSEQASTNKISKLDMKNYYLSLIDKACD